MVERVREREVASRIRVTDAEIDALIEERRSAAAPTRSSTSRRSWCRCRKAPPRRVVAERRERAQAALRRVRGGEDFAARRPRDVAGRQSRRGRRDRHAAGRPPARPVRQGGPAVEAGRGRRPTCCAAPPAFTSSSWSSARTRRLHASSRSRARHILLRPSAAADRRGGGAPADPVPARDPRRQQELRAARPRKLRGRQRRAGRRPRLGLGRLVRARVRGGDRRARGRRHLRAGGDALRRAPGPGGRPAPGHARQPSSSASRRGTSCASRSSRRPTSNGCATCAAGPTSSCATRRSSGERPGPWRRPRRSASASISSSIRR